MSSTVKPKNDPKQGEVYLIEVQFYQDTSQSKIRPVVIVSNDKAIDLDVMTAPITSMQSRDEFDVEIEHWQEAGLAKKSVARTAKRITFSKNRLRHRLGALHPEDLSRVLEQCKKVYDPN